MAMEGTERVVDDLGIGVLASPYIAKALANGLEESRYAPLRAIGAGAARFDHAFHGTPLAELAGLAMLAPTSNHAIAAGIDKVTGKTAAFDVGVAAAFLTMGL